MWSAILIVSFIAVIILAEMIILIIYSSKSNLSGNVKFKVFKIKVSIAWKRRKK